MKDRPGFENFIWLRGTNADPLHHTVCQTVEVGEPVLLEREPQNPYDPRAVAVLVVRDGSAKRIGYIPKELAGVIGRLVEAVEAGYDLPLWGAKVHDAGEFEDGAIGVSISFTTDEMLPRPNKKGDSR